VDDRAARIFTQDRHGDDGASRRVGQPAMEWCAELSGQVPDVSRMLSGGSVWNHLR